MSATIVYEVPLIHCSHCVAAIEQAVGEVAGVDDVGVDLQTKTVAVRGSAVDDAAVRTAIDEAGYAITSSMAVKT